MSKLWVVRMKSKHVGGVLAVIFKVADGELPDVAANYLNTPDEDEVIEVLPAEEFIGLNYYYELTC